MNGRTRFTDAITIGFAGTLAVTVLWGDPTDGWYHYALRLWYCTAAGWFLAARWHRR